jgi:hypothetical protein
MAEVPGLGLTAYGWAVLGLGLAADGWAAGTDGWWRWDLRLWSALLAVAHCCPWVRLLARAVKWDLDACALGAGR